MSRLVLFLILVSQGRVYAQFTDSLRIVAGTAAIQSTNDHQPLWLVSNRYGAIADRESDLFYNFNINNRHSIIKQTVPDKREKEIYLEYSFDIYHNNSFNDFYFQEVFGKVGYRNWVFRVGRFKEIVGEVDPQLSSGSLGISGNALPIPQIQLIVTEFTPLIFTNGYLSFKGQFSHGWMGKNRYMKDAFLHDKTFYLRFGKGKFKISGGIQHFAVWGGRRDDWLHLDRSWSGFMDVVLARVVDDGSWMNGLVKNGTLSKDSLVYSDPNRAGDHRGVIEGRMEWENEKVNIVLYHQTPFDMGNGITFKNIDRLLGFSFSRKNPGNLFQRVVFELIYTKQMNDFFPSMFRESYYNNGIYKTGWEYEDKIIGTPLFTNRVRGSKYFSNTVPYDWNAPHNEIRGLSNIINNRIIGGHIGISLKPSQRIQTRTLFTFTRNYGTHTPRGPFVPPLNQVYTLQEIRCQSPVPRLRYTGALGFDYGEMTKNVGVMAGLEYLVFGN